MEGICRKHLRQMQQSWGEKRNKELVVPEPLLQHVADESNRRNEKSEGREGGRIVRKLMAELIESPIQRAATAEPAEYQECRAVVLEARFPQSDGEGAPQAPQITVRFETNKAEQAASQEGAVDHVG
jgi:ATP-dependent Clp protease ATP-binding subunit ClpC